MVGNGIIVTTKFKLLSLGQEPSSQALCCLDKFHYFLHNLCF